MIAVDARPPTRESRTISRRVSHDGFVEVETNHYPVPYGWCRTPIPLSTDD
jgi:hypothetical protein